MARGSLRIYLGPAPGVGKTYAMLDEGWRRRRRGTDVVVGFVETHGRENTRLMIRDLEVVPRRTVAYRGATLDEMDVDAVIARAPTVALVDELAHTNAPGSRNPKRWQDVEQILDAGIDVIATLNIQHLESVNDVIEQITGAPQRETIPDAVVRRADQIELVDMSPEALRRRMAHGNIYPPDRIDAALRNYFRPGNLGALREIALLWTADRVEEALQRYRERHGIDRHWETRERIVVAMTGAPGDDMLVRRAARTAMRAHGDLVGVHVIPQDGLTAPDAPQLARDRALLEELGGVYRQVAAPDVAEALVTVARTENATRLVLGASRRSRLQELIHGSVVNRVLRLSAGEFDVAVIATPGPAAPAQQRLRVPASLSRRRRLWGFVLAACALPLLTVVLTNARSVVTLPSALLLYLVTVIGVAAVGGLWPAVAAATASFLLVNWYFTPPVHTFTIGRGENLLALSVFLGVAVVVSALVELAARRAADGASARAEAEMLARLAGAAPVPNLLEGLVRTFGLDGASVLHRDGARWIVDAGTGSAPPTPEAASSTLELDDRHVLATAGPAFGVNDSRVVAAFAQEITTALTIRELEREAAHAEDLARAGELRAALLAAVSHDLRTPLAAIRAAVTSLLETDVQWPPDAVEDFLSTIDIEAERLDGLLGNLLDMSRIQTGAVTLTERAVALDEVVPAALNGLGARGADVDIDVSESLPPAVADPALLERVIANLVTNALEASPPDRPVRIVGSAANGHLEVRVVDHGGGIAVRDRERAFLPFQRLGDGRGGAGGVGLGLAVAKGFVEAMHGSIAIEDTPGGGATMVVHLKAVA
jgi:two-component system sensor histidine kinase KdpD